jgi:hypothetical protein
MKPFSFTKFKGPSQGFDRHNLLLLALQVTLYGTGGIIIVTNILEMPWVKISVKLAVDTPEKVKVKFRGHILRVVVSII